MGASVRAETGAFHNPVGNFSSKDTAVPSACRPARPGDIRRAASLPGTPGSAPARGSSAAPAGSGLRAIRLLQRRRRSAWRVGRRLRRRPASTRSRATSRADGRGGGVDVGGGGESPERQPQRALRELGVRARARAARNSARGWPSCRPNPSTPRSPARPVTRLSPSTPSNETLSDPGHARRA